MSPAEILAVLSAIQAVAGDKALVEQIVALVKGPVSAGRVPTSDEWAQLNALADQGHVEVQGG